ncbi:hypothetical protein [Pseudomonas sp.]|uniref:hypothetical protein n=1 Tax=Pseudomonas sp. TaxID=306 RepID=UPI002915B129|nr:hypothetical protein [Pseudomonas sp.]MDU4254403.1 hypothetical protein [Pseudomonas sp.]
MTTTNANATRQLAKPVPDNCSDRYASGWEYADWYISKGGNLDADTAPRIEQGIHRC